MSDLYEVAMNICSKKPQNPCTIQLLVETDETVQEYDVILDFTLICMKLLFGENSTPENMTTVQFELLNNYIKSIGYCMVYDRIEHDDDIEFRIKFDKYKVNDSNPLEYLKKYM